MAAQNMYAVLRIECLITYQISEKIKIMQYLGSSIIKIIFVLGVEAYVNE